MSEWSATNQLRYVNRTVETEESGGYYPILTTYKILQQKWVTYIHQDGIRFLDQEEWRDVPTVQESNDDI